MEVPKSEGPCWSGGRQVVARKTAISVLVAVCWFVCSAAAVLAGSIEGYAFVNDDGTLRIRGRTIRLFGIHIPKTNVICKEQFRPPICGRRASVALKFKLNSGWPRCEPVETHRDRSITAVCVVDDLDLGAYLLEYGWAVATPDAPIEYHTLEKIARSRRIGVWGIAIGE